MDIFFQDPNDVRLRPEEVRVREIQVMPLLDSNRVKVFVELTPFLKRPNLEITITTASGKEVAHASILETMLRKVEVIMHMRGSVPGSEYTLESMVYYQSLPEPSDTPMDLPLPDPMIVDRQKVIFLLPRSES